MRDEGCEKTNLGSSDTILCNFPFGFWIIVTIFAKRKNKLGKNKIKVMMIEEKKWRIK